MVPPLSVRQLSPLFEMNEGSDELRFYCNTNETLSPVWPKRPAGGGLEKFSGLAKNVNAGRFVPGGFFVAARILA